MDAQVAFDFSTLLFYLTAFFLGSIPFAYLAGRLRGLDIRQHGSGNIGATNAFRVLGPFMGTVVLLLDAGKGAVVALWAITSFGETVAVIAGLAAILGHTFSPFMKFKGGKGVATAAGVVITLIPDIALICVLLFATIVALSKYVSLGSITVAITLPLLAFFFNKPLAYQIFSLATAVFVIYRHIPNIKRLLAGEENSIRRNQSKL
ncbi:glycerol-3-phosphate acyltransferase [Heliorestis acidaminivorans]|uniref:Glycerol-3-phosphate acyltransferase n=1 Tax=Heliorestis acidaminivorans TaxID=553427 RepID=A0A6I0EVY7_9FIRM|nr:glycerol-3-phosphate 1-O-acyltransferase PlsY [Heliorestis acidaminivorans]KAB2954584.1 glycerol-3-phosphate acyltransferase [Heliorestis acidaminivorans]